MTVRAVVDGVVLAESDDTVVVEGNHPNTAWTYRRPTPLARRIKNRVAFWGVVDIEQS